MHAGTWLFCQRTNVNPRSIQTLLLLTLSRAL
jgi:hypothetical protein